MMASCGRGPVTLAYILILTALKLHDASSFTLFDWKREDFSRRRSISASIHSIAIVTLKDQSSELLGAELSDKIDRLVQERSKARDVGDFSRADLLLNDIRSLELPYYLHVAVQDMHRRDGGGSRWILKYKANIENEFLSPTVLNNAHASLGLAVSAAEAGVSPDPNSLQKLVTSSINILEGWDRIHNTVERRATSNGEEIFLSNDLIQDSSDDFMLWTWVETDLTGRKAADAAFWFAMAGCTDERLFDLLVDICTKEIKRWGCRDSCRPKDIIAIENRLSAAGVRGCSLLNEAVQYALHSKADCHIEKHGVDLHSDRCALLIWKFSTRQRKQRSFLKTAAKHWKKRTLEMGSAWKETVTENRADKNVAWSAVFEDPKSDMVLDIGCGMGVSLLGLALDEDWKHYNMLGVDLSSLAIGYGHSLSTRWHLSKRLAFIKKTAQQLVGQLDTYPGNIRKILIQFPTPYRLEMHNRTQGNSQLPCSATNGFMVTLELLISLRSLLLESSSEGELVLQSNCEDVAVFMKELAVEAGFTPVNAPCGGVSTELAENSISTQRTRNWISMGGARAIGTDWHRNPILPREGRTETEVACMLNGIPLHRVILKP